MSTRSFRLMAPAALAAAALAALACPKPGPIGGAAARPECPRDLIYVPQDSGVHTTMVIAASGPISMVPEYHDCQRFVTPGQDGFGPLIAVFASSGLDSVSDPPSGPFSATNVVVTGRDEKAAATILDYDGDYEPLRIQHGINCLYLFSRNGEWIARIFSVKDDAVCLQPFAGQGINGGRPLNVAVQPGSRDRNPPVARWDWDAEAHEHYLGIRCGRQWCEVFNPSQPRLHASASYTGAPPVTGKGFYDEQNLAVSVAGQPANLVPGGVVGTIFPVGDLAANVLADFDSTWKLVALVSLAAPSPAYLKKFNFIVGPQPNGKTQVFLCRGDATACKIPAASGVNDCANAGDPWWAKIVSETQEKYRCVVRRTHPGVPIPGATRWRWRLDDEDIWIRCPEGCCEVT